MIKLSLCIPTYNRVEDLKITLEEIINQLKKLDSKTRSEIHVHIQDNCSSDNSSYLIKKSPLKSEFINNGILFTYEVNKKNLGFDRNVLKCIENSLGKYIWLISDDDHIFNSAIKKVFEYTVENFDMVNFQFNQLPNSILKPFRKNDYTEVNLSKNTFRDLIILPKLTICMYKVSSIRPLLKKLNIGKGFVHSELNIILALMDSSKCLYSSFFIGETRNEKKLNSFPAFVFNHHFNVLKKIVEDFRRYDLLKTLGQTIQLINPATIALKILIVKNIGRREISDEYLKNLFKELRKCKPLNFFINPFSLIIFSICYVLSLVITFIRLILNR